MASVILGSMICLAALSDVPDSALVLQQRLAQARAHFAGGYYRYAYQAFEALAATGDGAVHVPALVAMADCQMAWGDDRGAIETLQGCAAAARSPDWHRAMAWASRNLGAYDQAIASGRQALAMDPHHTRARYELGRLYETLGRREAALDTYAYFNDLLTTRMPESAADMHYAGLGFYHFSLLSGRNFTYRTKYVLWDVLQQACEVVDRSYWPARLAIADLLFEKYNLNEARDDYSTVLSHNPHCVEAHLGLGRIALDAWDFDGVEKRVAVCLDINPRSTPATLLLAALRMLERRYEEARDLARAALHINPNDLEALAWLAAAQIRLGETAEADAATARIYQLSDRPAVLHRILGQQFSSWRQFPEAEAELTKAIELDPTDAAARNELAMMYMQWGYEDRAREVVQQALDLDAFNEATYYTERLLDDLSTFSVHASEHFEIHYDARYDAVLAEYASAYLESIYEELCEDYEAELDDTTIVEFFPDHRKFGVRIHGKPWIHTVGACTGRVIAMDAPRRDVQGPYNFAHVLRHEFTHTVTLAATRNRIPHWLTEGLAVLQEDLPKRWSWRQLLADRLRKDALFSVEEIDWGFMRPRRRGDRQVAYAQSEWMCEFLIERFGYDVIQEQLALYRQGEVQRTVLQKTTGFTPQQFDAEFQAWALQEAGAWGLPLNPPTDPLALLGLLQLYPLQPQLYAERGEAALAEGHHAQALKDALLALALDPHHRGGLRVAAATSVALASEQPSPQRAEQLLLEGRDYYEQLADHHPDEPAALAFLAEWAHRHDDAEGALRRAQALKRVQPLNPLAYRVLSGVYLERGDEDPALAALLELARHEQHDADVPRQIARIYRGRDQLRAAQAWYRRAIYIDPYDVDTHRRLAGVLDQLQALAEALREYRVLTLLEPEQPAHFNELAFAYQRAGLRDEAREAARQAVALDPAAPARRLLAD